MMAAAPTPRPPRRLQTRLLLWILGALVVVWASFVFWGYLAGVEEADELTDGHLASVAALVLNMPVIDEAAPGKVTQRANLPGLRAHDYQQSQSLQMWNERGEMLLYMGNAPLYGFKALEEGFFDIALGEKAQPWRTFT